MIARLPRPTAGVLDGATHLYPLRIYYEETDAGGIVYHAEYLGFAERARTEMMRVCGLNHLEMIEKHGLVFAVHSADLKYLNPAKLEDELVVQTSVSELGGASITMDQKINIVDSDGLGAAIADIKIKLVILDESGRPQRLPNHIKTALKRLRDEKG